MDVRWFWKGVALGQGTTNQEMPSKCLMRVVVLGTAVPGVADGPDVGWGDGVDVVEVVVEGGGVGGGDGEP